jgi:Protein of unknown function (DUF3035)
MRPSNISWDRRRQPALAAAALACCTLALTGCGTNLSRTFGLTRDAPDEFTVTTRAPLSMPPDFVVRPPQPGAPRPQEQPAPVQAEQALVPQQALAGNGSGNGGSVSPGQKALVQAAGPTAPSNIRAEVNQSASADQPNQSFVNKLMFWRKPDQPGIVVDPSKEAQRLRENSALGQSPEVGDTPIIQPRQKGFLEGLF